MDLLLDDQERLIQETARGFFAAESTPATVRAAEEDPRKYSPELWRKVGELGWLGVSLPESCGGQALPLTYAGLLLEEAGRHAAPAPLHSTMAAALALARHDSERFSGLLAQVASAQVILTFAVQGADGAWSFEGTGLDGNREGKGVVLNGVRSFVDNFRIAHRCLALYRDPDGGVAAALVDPAAPGVRCTDLVTTAKDSQATVRFDNVFVAEADIVADGDAARRLAGDLCDLAAALMTSQLAGAARRDMEFAVEYAKQREAFGQPIGAFQAIQNYLATAWAKNLMGEYLSYYAAWLIDNDLPSREAVSTAKAFVGYSAVEATQLATQLHGGLGATVDARTTPYLRWAKQLQQTLGNCQYHEKIVASEILDRDPLQLDEKHAIALS